VNAEVDDLGNSITNDDEENGPEVEVIIAESFCEPTKILYMLELMLAFHAWYKKGHQLCLKTPKDKKKCSMLSEQGCMKLW